LKNKFEKDQLRIKKIQELAMGGSALGILKELAQMDKDEK